MPGKHHDDELVLLRGTLAGDARATRDLLSHVLIPIVEAAVRQEALRARLYRLDIEDAVQDALDRLYKNDWESLRRFEPARGTLRAYVSRIARHVAIDTLKRPRLIQSEQDLETSAVSQSDPEGDAFLGEKLDHLGERLEKDDILLFHWRWCEGLEPITIAARLGISVDAAYKRLQRLEAEIRAVFSRDERTPS